MQTVIIVVHLMIVAAMIGLVLLQKSEGGGLGMGGGGGGFLTSRGTSNVLTRTTAILAAAFFCDQPRPLDPRGLGSQATLDPAGSLFALGAGLAARHAGRNGARRAWRAPRPPEGGACGTAGAAIEVGFHRRGRQTRPLPLLERYGLVESKAEG